MAQIEITGIGAPVDFATGATVTVTALPAGATSYKWTFIDKPEGSAAAFADDEVVETTFTADVEGTYLIQLVIGGIDVARAIAAAPFEVAAPFDSIRPPAAGEILEADLQKGWSRELQKLFAVVAAGGGAVATKASYTFKDASDTSDVLKVEAKEAGVDGNTVAVRSFSNAVDNVTAGLALIDNTTTPEKIVRKEQDDDTPWSFNLPSNFANTRAVVFEVFDPSTLGGTYEFPFWVAAEDTSDSNKKKLFHFDEDGVAIPGDTIDLSGLLGGGENPEGIPGIFPVGGGVNYIILCTNTTYYLLADTDLAPTPGTVPVLVTWASVSITSTNMTGFGMALNLNQCGGGLSGLWGVGRDNDMLWMIPFSGGPVPGTATGWDISTLVSSDTLMGLTVDPWNYEMYIFGAANKAYVIDQFTPGSPPGTPKRTLTFTGVTIEDGTIMIDTVDLTVEVDVWDAGADPENDDPDECFKGGAASSVQVLADAINGSSTILDATFLLETNDIILLNDPEYLSGGASGATAAPVKIFRETHDARYIRGDGEQCFVGGIAVAPVNGSHPQVFVNGVLYSVGDGVKTEAFYFSNDTGTTARFFDDMVAGDTLHFNSSVAGFLLTDGDIIDLVYLREVSP